MKKLLILMIAIVLAGVNAELFAQSTGSNPAPGATHNYFITPGNSGNTILWTVTKGDLTTDAGDDVQIVSPGQSTTDIIWEPTVTEGDWYYVHVLETDGDGCSNEKVLPVQVTASPFFLSLAAANSTQCYNGAVVVTIDGSDPGVIKYDHGNATIAFTVTPAGLSSFYDGYEFNINLNVPAGYVPSPSVSDNASIDNGEVTVTDHNAVTITYNVDNTNLFTNDSDMDGTAADFTATATISGGKTSNGVSDNETGGIYQDETDVSRPHTSGIGTK